MIGFARKIGPINSFIAELWALRDGLFLCLQAQVQALIVEMDAKVLVDALTNQNNSNVIISSLMDDCRQLAAQIPQVRYRHVYREVNRCADHLAKLGSSLDVILLFFPILLWTFFPLLRQIAVDCMSTGFVLKLCFLFSLMIFPFLPKKEKKEDTPNPLQHLNIYEFFVPLLRIRTNSAQEAILNNK